MRGRTRWATGLGVLALAVLALAVFALAVWAVGDSARLAALTGNTNPGAVTAAAELVGYFLATLAGAGTLGGLVHVLVTASPDPRGVLDPPAFGGHLIAERVAVAWTVTAAAMVALQAAGDAGRPVWALVRNGGITDAVLVSEQARAWLVTAVAAAVTAVVLRATVRWIGQLIAAPVAAVGVLAPAVSGNAGQGPDHDLATSAAIVFALSFAVLAGVKLLGALGHPATSARRLDVLGVVAGALAVGYGATVAVLLLGPTGLIDSAWAVRAVAGVAVVAVVWLLDLAAALRPVLRLPAGVGAVGVIAATALMASTALEPAPGLLAHPFSAWDVYLGYRLPDPPSVASLLSTWRFDTFLGVGALAMAGVYGAGYLRLRRRGDRWPTGRLVSWLAGCLVLVVVTGSGVKAYGSAMFSVHMAEHMTLNMFVPVLLVLGGPVTLALRALPAAGPGAAPGPREWLLWLVHSRLTAFLSHPVVAFALFVGSLYAVYFTPVLDTLLRYHWGHELMSLHFLVVGYLFFWAVIGIDPGPRRLPFLGRLGLLFAVMPFHAFFGIATMTMASLLGASFYRSVDLPWLASRTADQHLGGAIAWGSSELPVILVVVALVAQWARQDRRAAARADRHADADYADDELAAYNAMLAELARTRR